MSFDAQKTILLEKQYLYIRASKGFELEGVSTERIWTNTGYYRFLVDNVAKTLGNSYVTVHYDSSDIDFIAYCSDLFMEELQNSIVVAVENIQDYLQQFAEQNHDDITTFGEGVSDAMEILHLDNEKQISMMQNFGCPANEVYPYINGNSSSLASLFSALEDLEVSEYIYMFGYYSNNDYSDGVGSCSFSTSDLTSSKLFCMQTLNGDICYFGKSSPSTFKFSQFVLMRVTRVK